MKVESGGLLYDASVSHDWSTMPEQVVVHSFLHVMSQQDIYEAMAKSLGLLHVIKAVTQRLKGLFSGSAGTALPSVDTQLVEEIMADLEGMTAKAWPEAVYAMGADELLA